MATCLWMVFIPWFIWKVVLLAMGKGMNARKFTQQYTLCSWIQMFLAIIDLILQGAVSGWASFFRFGPGIPYARFFFIILSIYLIALGVCFVISLVCVCNRGGASNRN